MSLVVAGAYALHVLVAGLWTGSVVFVSYAILPLGRDGTLNATPLATIAIKLQTLSRYSALLLLASGAGLAVHEYTVSTLTETADGHLVLGMIVLWFVLTALVEVGTGRLLDGTNRDKVREPARKATNLFRAAAVVAGLVLIDAGLLAGHGLEFL